jgi:hypothetical protein
MTDPEFVVVTEWHGVEDVDDVFGEDLGLDQSGDVGVFDVVGRFILRMNVFYVADGGGVLIGLLFGLDEFLEELVELGHLGHCRGSLSAWFLLWVRRAAPLTMF